MESAMKKVLLLSLVLIAPASAEEIRVVNEAAVRKLCPNPNARCLVRDNPDFYKDADPELYKRITKPRLK
jgi:hypothetical protein